jgi:histidinol phosphatase-like PHP family hydrolase
MDMYVDRIQKVIRNEPIDIFVNPTLLPEVLRSEYDILWTEARMQKVIATIAARKVALEINNRYRIPSATFIKMAKQAGVKFSFGTNNTSAEDLQRLEYCLDMMTECDLTAQDMFIPQTDDRKAVVRAAHGND